MLRPRSTRGCGSWTMRSISRWRGSRCRSAIFTTGEATTPRRGQLCFADVNWRPAWVQTIWSRRLSNTWAILPSTWATSKRRRRYRIGDLNGLGTCHNNIAEVHRSRGDPAAAIQAYLQAQDEWSATGNAVMVGVALTGLGAARIELGDSAQGRADLLDAERRFEAAGSTLYLAEMYRYLAISRLAEGDPQAAAQDVERSLEYALGAGARNQLATTQRVQAQIALAAGQIGRARELLEESRQTLRDIGDIAELARTEA